LAVVETGDVFEFIDSWRKMGSGVLIIRGRWRRLPQKLRKRRRVSREREREERERRKMEAFTNKAAQEAAGFEAFNAHIEMHGFGSMFKDWASKV